MLLIHELGYEYVNTSIPNMVDTDDIDDTVEGYIQS